MSNFESLSAINKNNDELFDDEELQELINLIDTETEAELLFLELDITDSLPNLKNSLVNSLQEKILNGNEKALGLFKHLRSLDIGVPNIFLQKIQNTLDESINLIEGFSSICSILDLNNDARTEYGVKLLVNKVSIKKYSDFFNEISFLQKQFELYPETEKLIQVEGILALGKISNASEIDRDIILEKYRILFSRKQSLYYMQDRNKTHYENVEEKSVQLHVLHRELQAVKKEMVDIAKKRPGALTEALSRGVVPIFASVMQGYKLKRMSIDVKSRSLLQKHDAIIQSIRDLELSIFQVEQEKIKQNNLIGILYQFRAIVESNKDFTYPATYDNTKDRATTLSLIRTDPGLQYLNSMYESMGMDFIRLLNTNTPGKLHTKDPITGEEILYNQNLKNGIALFESFHSYGVAREKSDISTYVNTELGIPGTVENDTGLGMNEYDVIQALQSGEIQTVKQVVDKDKKSTTVYGTVKTNREHLAYLSELSGEQYIQKSLDEVTSGKTPLIYIKQFTDSEGNFTLSYSVQRPFNYNNLEDIKYTDITSEKVNESNGYLIGLDKSLTEYGNFTLNKELGLLQTAMDKINPLSDLLGSLDGGVGKETSITLQKKVREVNTQVDFSSLLGTCTILKNEGVPYLQELQRVFNTRKGAILTPAEKAFEKKLQDIIVVCESALETYQSLYNLLKNPENIQPNDLKNWFINNGIPMLIAIGAAVAAITISVSTFGIGAGVGGMILTAGIGTAAGMVGNEIGHYASTKVGQSVYGDTYGNYTMLQKWGLQTWRGAETTYDGRGVAEGLGVDFVQGFTVTLLTLGLARGVVSSIEQQALQPGVLGNGARRLVNLLRTDQELFTQAGHNSFMKKFGKEYLEELGEEGVGESAKRIDSRLGFVAEVLINSKIQPNFIVNGKSATIQSTNTPTGKKVTIQCDGETFLENGEKHYLDLNYEKSISATGTLVFTNSVTNKTGETYTHTVELIPSIDPYIVREINAVINPAHGYVIKMGDKGAYTVEDQLYSGNAIERHLPAIIALANRKGMIVSDLGNGDISIRFGNQEVVIKNTQDALQKSRLEKIKQYKNSQSLEQYFNSINRSNQGSVITETNNSGTPQKITWTWGLTTNSLGIRYATIHLTSSSVDGSGGGMDPMYLSSFPLEAKNRILQKIKDQINTDLSKDIYLFIKDKSSVRNLPIYNISLSSTELLVADQFKNIIGRREALSLCSEHQSREHKQIILEKFGFTENQQTYLKQQQWFFNSVIDTNIDTQSTSEIGQSSSEIAQELDKEEALESEKYLLGGAAAVRENMTNDAGRSNNAMNIVNEIAPGSYTEEQRQAITSCVQEAHKTANYEVERKNDGTVVYIYDKNGISIPNYKLGGLRKKLDILKTGLSGVKKTDSTSQFTDKQISEIAKKLMRSGLCAEPLTNNNAVELRIQKTLSTKGETILAIEKIGSGGNGTVYLVTTVSGKTYAMKVIDSAGSEIYYREEIQRQYNQRQQVNSAGIATFVSMEINIEELTVTTEYVAGAFDPLNDSIGTRSFRQRGITREQLQDVSDQLDTIYEQAEKNNIALEEEDVFFFVYDSTTDTYKVIVGDYDNVGLTLGGTNSEVKNRVIDQFLPYVVETKDVGERSKIAANELIDNDGNKNDDIRDGKRNSMSKSEQTRIIENGDMSTEEKIKALGIEGCFEADGTSLNELGKEIAHRIESAHDIGSERGFGNFTRKDIQEKMHILWFGDKHSNVSQKKIADSILQGEKARKAIEEGFCGISTPRKTFSYIRDGKSDSFQLNTCHQDNKPNILQGEMKNIRTAEEKYSIDLDRKMTEREIEKYLEDIYRNDDVVKNLNDSLETEEISDYLNMRNALINSVRMLTVAELEAAMSSNAVELAGRLKGKKRAAYLDEGSQGSKSRTTMTKLFCSKVQENTKDKSFTRSVEANNDNNSQLHSEDIDYIVISDDASYSGEQILSSIDSITNSFVGKSMPPIVINVGFASQKLLQTFRSGKYKLLIDQGKLIIPSRLIDDPSRTIQNVDAILNSAGYSILEYNNMLQQIHGSRYTPPGLYGPAAKCPGLEATQTTTYCAWKIPNNKSLINPVRNLLRPFTPVYKQ